MELMKIRFAISHYGDHEAQDPRESFVDFLYEHYVGCNHGHEKDGHCDEEMPFKHCGDCCHHHVLVLPFTLPEVGVNISSPDYTRELPMETKEQFVSSCAIAIWQPPKIG